LKENRFQDAACASRASCRLPTLQLAGASRQRLNFPRCGKLLSLASLSRKIITIH